MRKRKLRIVAYHSDTSFRVEIRWCFIWFSAYVWTDYFAVSYGSKEEAIEDIVSYRVRHDEVDL